MQPSSPLYFPQTPSSSRFPLQHRPPNSSPLVDSPGKSSPIAAAQARRKSQYKAHVPLTPLLPRSCSSSRTISQTLRSFSNGSPGQSRLSGSVEADPQKMLARDRLNRYLEKAGKAREKAVRGRRFLGVKLPNRDEFTMDDDDEEDDDDVMQDELFRRIVSDANRKQKHAYRISYAIEVGSSFDPDLEDVSSWERELADAGLHASPSKPALQLVEENILPPEDFDEEELQEYAEEYTRLGYADSEGTVEEYLLAWSDGEELSTVSHDSSQYQQMGEEDGMDMS